MPGQPQLFWDFSVQLYDQQGVADACLQLQNEFNIDVNLVLFCYWHGSYFGEVDQKLMRQVINFSLDWRDNVVQPLRNLRMWMKKNTEPTVEFDDLRQKIKINELAAEKYQQEMIEILASSTSCQEQTSSANRSIRANLKKFLQETSLEFDERMEAILEKITKGLKTQAPSCI